MKETVDKIINLIKDNNYGTCGIFDTVVPNGDIKERVFNENGVMVYVCKDWKYIEIKGLSGIDFNRVKDETF